MKESNSEIFDEEEFLEDSDDVVESSDTDYGYEDEEEDEDFDTSSVSRDDFDLDDDEQTSIGDTSDELDLDSKDARTKSQIQRDSEELQRLVIEYKKTGDQFLFADIYRHPTVRRMFNNHVKTERNRLQGNPRIMRDGFFAYHNGVYSPELQTTFHESLFDSIEKYDPEAGMSYSSYIYQSFWWHVKNAVGKKLAEYRDETPFSLDDEIKNSKDDNGKTKTRGDMIGVKNYNPKQSLAAKEAFRERILKAAEKLDPLERFILHVRILSTQDSADPGSDTTARDAMTLFGCWTMSQEEIAAFVGISQPTISAAIKKIRAMLREELAAYKEELFDTVHDID